MLQLGVAQCADVAARRFTDGTVHCADRMLVNVSHVTLTHFRLVTTDVPVVLYFSNTDSSTDKYILSADFYNVTVRNVTVDDHGQYQCVVLHGSMTTVTDTTLIVYGRCSITAANNTAGIYQ